MNYSSDLTNVIKQLRKEFEDYLYTVMESYGYSRDDVMKLGEEGRFTGLLHTDLNNTRATFDIDGVPLFIATSKTIWDEIDWGKATVERGIQYYITPEEWKERKGEKE